MFTNVSRSKASIDLAGRIAAILSRNLEKPLDRIRIHILPEQVMTFSGSAEPCAVMQVGAIGRITKQVNEQNTKDIMQLVSAELKIPPNRQTIYFADLKPENVGFNMKTFASP